MPVVSSADAFSLIVPAGGVPSVDLSALAGGAEPGEWLPELERISRQEAIGP